MVHRADFRTEAPALAWTAGSSGLMVKVDEAGCSARGCFGQWAGLMSGASLRTRGDAMHDGWVRGGDYAWYDLQRDENRAVQCLSLEPQELLPGAALGRWDASSKRETVYDPPRALRNFSSVLDFRAGAAANFDNAGLAVAGPA